MGESGVLRRSLPFLVALFFVALANGACRPAVETDPPASSSVAESPTSDLPPLLDPAPPREIVLGKLFAPDGSIQAADRTTTFAPGNPILLSIAAGDLPGGTRVIATWTAPDGTATDQKAIVVGGETYLTYTAPSAGWTPGAGQVEVRIGEPPGDSLRQEVPFEIAR